MGPEIKQTALRAAHEGGAVLMRYFGKVTSVTHKGEIDLVTEADKEAELTIVNIIQAAYPGHRILAEETGESGAASTCKWIIDPLDGTTNYAHGYPCFCISIAVEMEGEMCYGVIYDPLRKELFTAEKGKGAHLNGNPLKVSSTQSLNNSLLCTGFPYDIRQEMESNLRHFRGFLMKAQAVRRDGTAALDLCYTAAGRFDGFWEQKLRPWDVAAGYLIVTEAGGTVSDINGREDMLNTGGIIVGNEMIHGQLSKILKAARNA